MNFVTILSQRRSYLMGISIIMIMFFHNLWIRDVDWLKPINYYGHWGVDVFFFLSGYGIVYSLRKNNLKVYFRNRIFRIVPICVIAGLIKFVIFHYVLKNDSSWGWQIFIGFDLWYIKAILILYCLSPLIFKYLDKYVVFFLILSYIVAIVTIHVTTNGFLCLFIPRTPVYLLGMMVANHMLKINKKLLIVSFCFFIFAVLHYWSFIEGNGWFWNQYASVIFLSVGAFFFMWLMILCFSIFRRLYLIPLLEFTGRHSLELFIAHVFIYRSIIPIFYKELPSVLIFITAVVLSYLMSYVIFLLRKILVPFK